jgi:integration host factor subunit beta
MLRSDLVRRLLAQNPHLYLQDVEKIVDALFDEIIDSMARGNRIELRGFGTFAVKVHEARTGRNPRTGAPVPVPKRAHPHFKTGKEMKERLNRQTASND